VSQGWTGRLNTESSLGLWGQLKEAIVPVAAYWLATIFGFSAFALVILLKEGGGLDDIIILGAFAISTFAGVAIGQFLAFLRVRTWLLLSLGGIMWVFWFTVGVGLASAGGGGVVGALMFCGLFLLPIALTGGLWSLETNRALWSTWLPLLYATGAVIVWAEATGLDEEWFAGNKWRIWDLVNLGVLGGSVALTLLFLVARETHRLALWRRGPMAPLMPSIEEKGAARPRVTFFGMLALAGLALALTIATAVVSPYLWRTGPGDREGETVEAPEEEEEYPPPEEGDGKLAEMLQKMAEAAKEAGAAVCTMLTVAFLAMLGMMIAWRPLRRLFTVRHLKDPYWEVPATTRVEQSWRLVEIALGDAGVHPLPGEDAAGLARRAGPVLRQLSPVEVHGMEDAAEVADRVRFGLGVSPKDVEVIERFARWAYDTVWERLGDGGQVRGMHRGI
jgi:hypothetical protein